MNIEDIHEYDPKDESHWCTCGLSAEAFEHRAFFLKEQIDLRRESERLFVEKIIPQLTKERDAYRDVAIKYRDDNLEQARCIQLVDEEALQSAAAMQKGEK